MLIVKRQGEDVGAACRRIVRRKKLFELFILVDIVHSSLRLIRWLFFFAALSRCNSSIAGSVDGLFLYAAGIGIFSFSLSFMRNIGQGQPSTQIG